MPIPKKYIPDSLSDKDKAKQKAQIIESKKDYPKNKYKVREKLDSFKTSTSKHIIDFRKRYPNIESMKDSKKIRDEFGISQKAIDKIISKGKGAYFSSGSRPNQNPDSWAYARLASTLLGRNACKVDKHVFKGTKVNCQQLKEKYLKKKGGSKCSTSSKPFPIIESNVELSYFKNAKNPIREVQKSVKAYNKGEYQKVYGGRFGISSLKAMGLVPRSDGRYNINSTTKPYCQNYLYYEN